MSGGNKIVSVGWASGAKLNKNQKMRRIKVKRERKKNKELILGCTKTRQIEPSNIIYKIHAYFIDKATNIHNNLEYNNIIFLI